MTPRAGLSLFELLVALALLAMISAGLAGALDMAVRVHDRARTAPQSSAEAALHGRLRGWLTHALPPTRLATFPVTFKGDADGFAFTTLAARGFVPEAAALRIRVARARAGVTVTITALDDEGETLETFERRLSEGSVPRIDYFDSAAEPPGWTSQWEDDLRLPDVIRLRGDAFDPAFVMRLAGATG